MEEYEDPYYAVHDILSKSIASVAHYAEEPIECDIPIFDEGLTHSEQARRDADLQAGAVAEVGLPKADGAAP